MRMKTIFIRIGLIHFVIERQKWLLSDVLHEAIR